MDPRGPDDGTDTTEFDAASERESKDAADDTVICPSCRRPVEAGFRFCDWCGKPLPRTDEPTGRVSFPAPQTDLPDASDDDIFKPPAAPKPPTEPKAAVPAPSPPVAPPPTPPVAPGPPKAEPTLPVAPAPPKAEPTLPVAPTPPKAEPTLPVAPAPAAAPPKSEPTAPVRASWPPTSTTKVEPSKPVQPVKPPAPPKPPKPARERREGGFGLREAAGFLSHLVVSLLVGALVLVVVATIVTLVSQGGTGFLERRGLPAFIAVASSVATFALLRGGDATGTRATRSSQIAAIAGLVILVLVGMFVYRPVYLEAAQERLDRLVGVWGDTDDAAAGDFLEDVEDWNAGVAEYKDVLSGANDGRFTLEQFRDRVDRSHNALSETAVAMETDAASADNDELGSALNDLAGAYQSQLAGLKLVSQGFLGSDIPTVRRGDEMYKDARQRAATIFTERARPVLERSDVDLDAFASAVEG